MRIKHLANNVKFGQETLFTGQDKRGASQSTGGNDQKKTRPNHLSASPSYQDLNLRRCFVSRAVACKYTSEYTSSLECSK